MSRRHAPQPGKALPARAQRLNNKLSLAGCLILWHAELGVMSVARIRSAELGLVSVMPVAFWVALAGLMTAAIRGESSPCRMTGTHAGRLPRSPSGATARWPAPAPQAASAMSPSSQPTQAPYIPVARASAPSATARVLPGYSVAIMACRFREVRCLTRSAPKLSLRTDLALKVGGFDTTVGRVSKRSAGCEDTELSIRLTAARPASVVLYAPAAAVDHHVGLERVKVGYFLRPCWPEGISKASIVRLAGASAGFERERRHVVMVIPAAFLRNLRQCVTGYMSAFMRFTALCAGLASTVAGYLSGRA